MHIIVSEKLDIPTDIVLKWYAKYNIHLLYIDLNHHVTVKFNGLFKPVFKYLGQEFGIDDIESIYFRRSRLKIKYSLPKGEDKNLFQYHNGTKFRIEEFLNYLLIKKVKTLGNPFLIEPNKLQVLDIANEVGLNTPITTISENNKETLTHFGKKPFITKLMVPLKIEKDRKMLNFFTFATTYNELSSAFSPSLFQEKIDKKYEIRVFYLKGQCYSKAIFSQHDKKTKDDYRNYNFTKPNRVVPFLLPKNVTYKLRALMDKLKLDTGSIDFIVNKQNEFIFLEVNPVGQFSDMSIECNYFLEKKIMEYML